MRQPQSRTFGVIGQRLAFFTLWKYQYQHSYYGNNRKIIGKPTLEQQVLVFHRTSWKCTPEKIRGPGVSHYFIRKKYYFQKSYQFDSGAVFQLPSTPWMKFIFAGIQNTSIAQHLAIATWIGCVIQKQKTHLTCELLSLLKPKKWLYFQRFTVQ